MHEEGEIMKDSDKRTYGTTVYADGHYSGGVRYSSYPDHVTSVNIFDVITDNTGAIPKQLRPRPHKFVKFTASNPSWTLRWNYPSWPYGAKSSYYRAGAMAGPLNFNSESFNGLVSAGTVSSLEGKTYNVAYDRLVDQLRGNLDLSIDLAEWKSTRELLQSFTKASGLIERLEKNLRHLGRDASGLRNAAELYLEFMLAIKPLCSSIYGVYDKLMSHSARGLHFRGRSREVVPLKSTGTWSYPNIEFTKPTISTVTQGELSVRCQIDIWLKNPDVSALQAAAEWTSLNPASIAWELTRLSFLWDWFYNIGSLIRQLETWALYRRQFDYGCVTYTSLCTSSFYTTTSSGSHNTYGGGSWTLTGGTASARRATKRREVLVSMPVPRPPILNLDLGSGQLLTLAALLRAAVKGRLRVSTGQVPIPPL